MPACPLSTLRRPPHDGPTQDSGSQLVASHYYVGTFTLYPLPAFTGAFDLTPPPFPKHQNDYYCRC